MPTLWTALRSRWLGSGDSGASDRLMGLDHLCEHLRRDIGLNRNDSLFVAPVPHRDRSPADLCSVFTLQPYR
ncbi:hypothetical protein [Azospirillum griseum]|uniref:Uncharacterized protein n=1 Tax=Azospirillum griseum TaxID=2496639 RepID=A0A431VJ69_9PROT|nr:hypothetical protein [Azospirillum griseum]RTR21991.1 hypothetical protein EJ903_07740 [Azospirillum griseum]